MITVVRSRNDAPAVTPRRRDQRLTADAICGTEPCAPGTTSAETIVKSAVWVIFENYATVDDLGRYAAPFIGLLGDKESVQCVTEPFMRLV
jgi:hypothetical protein